MFYYSHHIGDFDRATRHLTRIERSIYRDLLDVYYETEQLITLDLSKLKRKILANTEQESTAVEQVLKEFFTETPTGWFHARCDEEILAYQSNNTQKSVAGKASAAARAARKQQALNGTPTDVATPVEQTLNGTPTNQEPITNNQKNTVERATRGARLPIHFEPDFNFAKQSGVSNPVEEFEKFRDYWNSQAGAKAVKTDWQATWRNWCRNARKDVQKTNYEPPYAKYMREQAEKMTPSIAASNPNNPQPKRIDPNEFLRTIEAQNVVRIN